MLGLFFVGGGGRFTTLFVCFRGACVRKDHNRIGRRNYQDVFSVRVRRRENHIGREGHFRKGFTLLSVLFSLLIAGS